MRGEMVYECVSPGFSALPVAQRIDLQDDLSGDAERDQNVPAASNGLGVGERLRRADQFDADLVKLPVAPLLRALIAEHWAGIEHLLRQTLGETVTDQRPANPSGSFRAKRE